MDIKSFKLSNVGRFSDLDMLFAPTKTHQSNITVLLGSNGVGKSTVLKSLNICLSWLIARIRSNSGNGKRLINEDIRMGATGAVISIGVTDQTHPRAKILNTDSENELFVWGIARRRDGLESSAHSSLTEVRLLADHYRSQLTAKDSASLPLIVYYPVERNVLEIALKTPSKIAFDQIDGYDNTFNGGADFCRFFEWFRDREDSENEDSISDRVLVEVSEKFGTDSDAWKTLASVKASSRDRQLTAVRSAITAFMPGFANLRVQRKPHLHMVIDKHGETLNVALLSQGEKSLMALVGDIARRLAMMNPSMTNPLYGDGIVLIDEVELHFPLEWQHCLIQRLGESFPNCQFVLTTHSPLVIRDGKDVLIYKLEDIHPHD
ncbi:MULTISPECIES: AAA family ATPase [Pseudomonas]|uniref:ATP-binding protein involved in virulence n=1 Tax=Pseudomonas baetica TaxID=674054 RepID=A0ABX4PUU8_9PSED|nr:MULTISPECIES: AAA family ATPase [Pseudomonas]PKA68296.1 putative ATP-binding protein involved in virulence [Pseudomonas baetica]PTC17840.1 ATP-binding protein [Pseudomonas baetica]